MRKQPTVLRYPLTQYFGSFNPYRQTIAKKRLARLYPKEYDPDMIELERSRIFSEWLDSLKDIIGKGRIISRLRAAEHGNFGDCGFVGDTVYEMRVHYGPGYRVYFTRRDEVIYLLLIGGDKSTQRRDIKRAVQMAHSIGMRSKS